MLPRHVVRLCGSIALSLGLVAVGASAQRRGATGPAAADLPISELTSAIWTGNPARVEALLNAGANPRGPDDLGSPPWVWAVIARDGPSLRLMLSRITDIEPTRRRVSTMLLVAAVHDDLFLVGELLRRGVDVNVTAVDGSTALMLAAASGYTDVMAALLDHSADVGIQDQFGDAALMSAVRAGSLPAVRLLLAHHADVAQADHDRRTAMAWARRSRREDIMRALILAGAHDVAAAAGPAAVTARAAVDRSLPLLQAGANTWLERQRCASCHHQPMIERTTALAKQHGFHVNESFVSAQQERIHFNDEVRTGRLEENLKSQRALGLANGGDTAFGNGWFDAADLAAGVPPTASTAVEARMLERVQLPDGSWRPGPPRVPIESSAFTATANAARVLKAQRSIAGGETFALSVTKARTWLLQHEAASIDDKVYRLLGLRWTDAAQREVQRAGQALRRDQRADGGWSQLPGLNTDAYATGMTLVALHEGADLATTDPVYRRGVQYLLTTQEADGSWLVSKRAFPQNAYFESGFPHGKFQFISFAGTCWATMALTYAADMR
jgi:hypothetical protein